MNQLGKPKHSIVLLVDGLRPSSLGPYGNTWYDTNCFNQLASQSLLFEKCIADTTDLQLGIRSLLSTQHALAPWEDANLLVERLDQLAVEFQIVSSDRSKYESLESLRDSIVFVDLQPPTELARDISSSLMGQFFGVAIEVIKDLEKPTCLILDCPGFGEFWDAPYSFRESLADDEDPEPSDKVAAPSLQFNESTDDPDLLFEFQVAYGGQVEMLDRLLGVLFEAVGSKIWQQSLFCLTSTRGFPLGEHGVVGYYRPVLNAESIHVPLLIRWPETSFSGRSQCLVHPTSLGSALLHWHGYRENLPLTVPGIDRDNWIPNETNSGLVCSVAEQPFCAIQTCHWKYVSGPHPALYVKPDDIWEFNDVLELCPSIASQLSDALEFGKNELNNGRVPKFEFGEEVAFGVE